MIVKVKKLNTKLLTKDKYCKEDIIVQIDQSLVSPDIPMGTAEITTTEKVNVAPYEFAQVVDENLKAENIKKGVSILGIVGTAEGGSGGIPIEEVETLPTENIEENKIYVENKSELSIYANTGSIVNLSDMIPISSIVIVDSLPENPELSTDLGFYIYIQNGIPYIFYTMDESPAWFKISVLLFEAEGFDKGFVNDLSQISEQGLYILKENITNYAFNKKNIYQLDSNGEWANFRNYYKDIIKRTIGPILFIPNDVTSIGPSAFADCISLVEIKNAKHIATIGYNAFRGCASLKNIDSLESLISLDNNAFYDCGIKSIDLSKSKLETISSGAFESCKYLESVILPYGLFGIGQFAFKNCTSLKSMTVPDTVGHIQSWAFSNCNSLSSIIIDGNPSIEAAAFDKCFSLTNISFPSVMNIKNQAFQYCNALTSVDLPLVTPIEDYIFNGCVSLISTNFPSATSIGACAFKNCSALTNISFPIVSNIKTEAFRGCSKLTDIYLGYNRVVSLTDVHVFDGGASNTIVHVKPNFDLSTLYAEATNWSSLIASGRITIVEDYVE